MRACTGGDDEREFADFLLRVGDGKLPYQAGYGGWKVQIPPELCLVSRDRLIDFVYCNDNDTEWDNPEWVNSRAIIVPNNKDAREINYQIMNEKLPGQFLCQYSRDTKDDADNVEYTNGDSYPEDFLHSLEPSGFPPHTLKLKPKASVMILRNMLPLDGHVNGARYTIKEIHRSLIVAIKATGANAGAIFLVPRIDFHSAPDYPFQFQRRQFPLKPAFAITSNKSQGQSYKKVGIHLNGDFFSHGQLYVALSRVGSGDNVRVFARNGGRLPNLDGCNTNNVVYTEVLD